MDYRTLGNSGCAVSSLCLGTMTFGVEADETVAHQQLDRFVEAGGTLVDTADVYGDGRSEQIVGRWFARRPAEVTEPVVLATKGRFNLSGDNSPNGAGLSARHLTRALDASLRRLGLDTVDLYQVHAFDALTPMEETLRTLDQFVRAGKIRYYGLSNFTGWQLTKAVHLARALNVTGPVTLQPQYSLLAREIEWEIVPAVLDAGMGMLPWSPLGGGWLSGKYRRDQRPTGATRLGEDPGRGMEAYDRRGTDRTWHVIDAVQKVAEDRGVSMAEVALAWVTARPGVSSTILGARTLDQLEANLRSAGLHLTAAETAALDAASDPHPVDYPYGELGIDQRSRTLGAYPPCEMVGGPIGSPVRFRQARIREKPRREEAHDVASTAPLLDHWFRGRRRPLRVGAAVLAGAEHGPGPAGHRRCGPSVRLLRVRGTSRARVRRPPRDRGGPDALGPRDAGRPGVPCTPGRVTDGSAGRAASIARPGWGVRATSPASRARVTGTVNLRRKPGQRGSGQRRPMVE